MGARAGNRPVWICLAPSAESQQEVTFTAAIAANTQQADAAKAFIAYVQSPEAVAVIKAKGMNPGFAAQNGLYSR